ncbi:MAG: ParB/RepB/Spo0J family partition protein [Gemmataceae bacterium]|nr:ParB/RepB/Spo0J family partition protein [Gemmataceae bacterium]
MSPATVRGERTGTPQGTDMDTKERGFTRSERGSLGVEAIRHNPYQPRKQFDDEDLKQLRDSIKTHGVLQPLVVRRVNDGFQLIAGERRLRAAQQAGLADVPVHIVEFNDQQVYEAALVENIQRADLNPIEKAQGFKDYLDRFKMTQDQLGTKLGLDRTTISNLLGLLALPEEVQTAVRNGQITLGHAKVLKGVNGADKQIALCKLILLQGLSVHALEQLVKHQKQAQAEEPAAAAKKPAVEKTAHVSSLEDDLRRRFACRVEIKVKAKDKGQIVIDFDTNDDFERILGLLGK